MQTVRLLGILALTISLLVLCSGLKAPSNDYRKKLQGPPSEFAKMAIPSPADSAVQTSSALMQATFRSDGNGGSIYQGSFNVDSTSELSVAFISPYEDEAEITFQPPNSDAIVVGKSLDPQAPYQVSKGPFGIDGASVPSVSYIFENPTVGTWNIQIQVGQVVPYDKPRLALLIGNKSPTQINARLNSYELQVGQEIGLVAKLVDVSQGQDALPLRVAQLTTKMEVVFPDGRDVLINMHDDGMHDDELAGDGIYGALVEAYQSGTYTAQAVFTGVNAQGVAFTRTTEHLFAIVQPTVTLTGLADVEHKSDKYLYFNLDIDMLASGEKLAMSSNGLTFKAYAEVWGTDSTGLEYTPVAWMQAMVDPQIDSKGERFITLQLHEDWVNKAGAKAPFQLRNAWLEDRETNVLLSDRNVIYVESTPSALRLKPNSRRASVPVTEEMTYGPRPVALRNATRKANAAGGKLLLVHGYCAGANEFPPSQFADSVQFQDFKKSRTNDEFALLLKQFGDQYPSFGIVGHSQAGLASLHLHTYYWSNLEVSVGGRKIQTVGSPYLGTGLAGSLAGIGNWFGIGCGRNTDLTYDGASLWERAIPSAPRTDLYFYSTQYKSGGSCVWAAGLVLYAPNDGTTEQQKAALNGANNQGHIQNWCHTSGMNYPAQCTDPTRNAEMSSNAAR